MSTIKKNYIYNSIYQVLVLIIPLVTTPYVSRVLTANGIGIYSYSFSVAQYFGLFIMLGINNYGNRSIAQARNVKSELRKTFWSIYSMQLLLGVAVLFIYILYIKYFSEDKMAAFIMIAYILSSAIDVNWYFFGMEMFKRTVLRNTFVKVFTTIGIFAFIKSPSDIYLYCLIMSLGMFLSQLVLWPYIFKEVPIYCPSFSEIVPHIIPNLYLFLTVLAVSIYKIMDKIMLGFMSTTIEVGYYESAERVILIPTSFITSLGTVMLPRMSNLFGLDRGKGVIDSYMYKSILLTTFLSTSMSFGLMAIAKEFVPLFYGDGYAQCVPLFLVLLPSCIFFGFGNVLRTQYIIPKEEDEIYVKSAFLGAVINLIINIILIPSYKSIGAAIGTLVAEASVTVYQAYRIRNDIDIRKYFRSMIPFLIVGLIMFVTVYSFNAPTTSLLYAVIIKIFIGVIIYLFGLYVFISFRKIYIAKLNQCN